MQENAMAKKLSRWYNTSKKKKKKSTENAVQKSESQCKMFLLGFLVFCSFGYQKGW